MRISFKNICEEELNSPLLAFSVSAWFLMAASSNTGAAYDYLRYFYGYDWAAYFAAAGILKAFALARGGRKLNFAAILISLVLWLTVCILVALGNYRTILVPITFFLAYVNFLRLRDVLKSIGKSNGL